MTEAKKKKTLSQELWEHYQSIQLTPEQRTDLRARMQEEIDRARADGVYERVLAMVGKYEPSISWEELREEDD